MTKLSALALLAVVITLGACKGDAKPVGGGFPTECSDYQRAVDTMMKCTKLKTASATLKEGFDLMWQQLESLPVEGRAAMATSCKAGAEGLATAMKAVGC